MIVRLGRVRRRPGSRPGLWLWALAYLVLVGVAARAPLSRARPLAGRTRVYPRIGGSHCQRSAARGSERAPARGRPARRRARCSSSPARVGQDARPHAPDRAPGRQRAARPGEILAITFTNKAAQEMRERVEQLVGDRARAMWVMTFHSACARMLRADAERLGYTRGFTIYDEQDSLRLVKRCIDELDVDPKRFTPRGDQAPDLRREERAARRRGLPRRRSSPSSSRPPPTSTSSTSSGSTR